MIKDFVDTVLSGTEPFDFGLRFALVNCNRTFPSSLTGCLFILNYSLRDLSTVSSMPKSSTRRKQGLYGKQDLNVALMVHPEYKRCY